MRARALSLSRARAHTHTNETQIHELSRVPPLAVAANGGGRRLARILATLLQVLHVILFAIPKLAGLEFFFSFWLVLTTSIMKSKHNNVLPNSFHCVSAFLCV